jgi:alpha-beta hydrolase superfamily lysophospholipase
VSPESFAAGDGYDLHYRRFRPALEPRARIVFLHGIQSHAGWYVHSCQRLQQVGFLVDFLDRRGAGANVHQRGDVRSYRRLIADVHDFLAHDPLESLPVYLAGISWGGKVAMGVMRQRPESIDGLILLCPGFFPRVRAPLGARLRIAATRLFRPGRLFPIPLSDPALFTSSPTWQEFIRKDKAALHHATARLLVESVRLDRHIRLAWKYVHAPVLLLLAQRDQIIDNKATRSYIERFATTDKTIIEYAGAQHTLEFEPDPEPFIHDVAEWVGAHVGSVPTEGSNP